MLEPASRRLLLESLSPPEGHRLDFGIATTYSLDLVAMLTAPVAFAFSDIHDREGRPVADPLALLKAVRQYAQRVLLFHQAGKIHVPRTYQPLLSSLENSIVEATAPLKGGTFHPKLWVLRFEHVEDGEVLYRVLCSSRNMTFDRSWDTLLCLEGPFRSDRNKAFARNHPLAEFVEALPGMASGRLSADWRRRVRRLGDELRRVEFELPDGFDDLAFRPLGLAEDEKWPFDRVDNLLVVSPFVDDALLGDLAGWNAPMQLVSRPEHLAPLASETLERFETVWILDDTAEPEPDAEAENEAADQPDETTETEVELAAIENPLVGLHAKLYVADAGWDAHLWTGSANATRSGFYRNVEFLVQLTGKKSRCGVDALLGTSTEAENGKKSAASLRDLLQPYDVSGDATDTDSEVREFERSVDRVARALAAADPEAICSGIEDSDDFRFAVLPTRPVDIDFDGTISTWPISLKPGDSTELDVNAAEWAAFRVSMIGLTSFFAFEATSPDESLARRFVLNVPLRNVPSNRDECVLREMLSDRDRVLRFLLLLLGDGSAADFASLLNGGNGESAGFAHSMFDGTLFEALMRSLHRDPSRIDQVADVIEDLKKSPEGLELLPEDLDSIWDAIWEVRRGQLSESAQ